MTASLTTTIAFLDLLPRGGNTPARRRVEAPAIPLDATPQSAEAGVPLRHRLLPIALRRTWADRAARRTLATHVARLRETSPHLLDDIGILDWDGTAPVRAEADASGLESVPSAARDTSWRLAGPMRPLDADGRGAGGRSSVSGWRAERPVWNAPDHWLR